jgi:GNAT superfamily N-acetyltransferase
MRTPIPLPRLDLRRARPDDTPAVASLVHDVWHETYGRALPRPVVLTHSAAHVAEEVALRVGHGWVACVGERIVGYCATAANCVEDLWVARRYRRRGIGRALLALALADLRERGYQSAQAGCEDFNAPARELLAREGWTVIGREPVDLGTGRLANALLYARSLDAATAAAEVPSP